MDTKKKTSVPAEPKSSPTLDAIKGGALTRPSLMPARSRLRVNKAYKMYVGGEFVRSESGRYVQVHGVAERADADPDVVNVPRASRKDVRDAVAVARKAQSGWAARTAFNRGQILYRLAEVMESRRGELVESVLRSGAGTSEGVREVEVAIDRSVYYAGFCDKISALLASHNPVAGPHFGFSIPEPLGVVAVIAPPRPALLGLVSTVLPAVAGGNACIVLASDFDPRTAIVFAECLATSDLPGGVVNVLTGDPKEIAPAMARHRDVDGLDVWMNDADTREIVEREAAGSVKRARTHVPLDNETWLDERAGQGIAFLEPHLEVKTIWHPVGV